jgi:hypothetical protein
LRYGRRISYFTITAEVVELVDALDSKSSVRKGMPVRFRPSALSPLSNKIKALQRFSTAES